MKKAFLLVSFVVLVHCMAVAALLLAQGCKTTKKSTSASASSTPVMPPLTAPAVSQEKTEAVPLSVKEAKGGETIEYVVKSGDSLGTIAKSHSISKAELIELNKIADPNKIRVGQKLLIPKRAHVASSSASKAHEAKPKVKKSEPAAGATLATGLNEYVVQAGDSLSKVASKFNSKVSELREVNKLVSDKLKVGQKLIIPGPKKTEGTPEAAPAPAAAESPASPVKSESPEATTPASGAAPAAGSSATAPKAAGSGITHVVMPKEDLSSIAKLYAVTVDDIVAANQLGTNRSVQAGQKLIIP